MMKCAHVRLLVHAALDAEVNREERETLDEHLSGCVQCGEYAKVFGGLKKRVSKLAEHPNVARSDVLERSLEACERPGQVQRWLSGVPFQRRRAHQFILGAALAAITTISTRL